LATTWVWAFWPTLFQAADHWWHNAQYSHGVLVPFFAAALLWLRREQMPSGPWQPSWWGLGLLALALLIRTMGCVLYTTGPETLALLLSLAALGVLLGGWPVLRWAWPAIVFLFFMLPLPFFLETALAYPLRRLATVSSTFALQLLGFPTLADGTDIHLGDHVLQVAPACSGLGMLLTFFAFSTAAALLMDRPWVERLVILLSAVPIAVLANIARITVTAVLYQVASEQLAHKVFHDWAGYLMMPVALALLCLELAILDRLFPSDDGIRRERRPVSARAVQSTRGTPLART
jgi:exosortase